MFKKNILKILVVCFALWQVFLTKRTNNEAELEITALSDLCQYKTKYSALQPSEDDNQLPPSIQLLKLTLSALVNITINYATKAKNITELVLKDANKLLELNNSDEVMDLKNKLIEFQKKYSSCQHIRDLLDIVVSYSTTIAHYFELENAGNLNGDEKVILQILKKYKPKQLDNQFEAAFNVFVSKFEKKFEDLKEEMKRDKLKIVEEINEWYEELKTLKTYDDRIESFNKFIKLYEIR